MKFLRLLVVLFVLTSERSQAQLPYPSIAPDFTLTDINGVSHNLHSYLDQDYQVILHIDAAYSQPGWSYLNSGWLQNIHNNYGVQNGGNVIVLFAETDPNTNINALYGNGGGSMGNWVANMPYPVIHDVSGSLNNLFNIGYYPTIYSICPNRIVREIGQPNLETLTQIVLSECAAVAAVDPMILGYTGLDAVCTTINPSVILYNGGNTPLTNGTFILTGGINTEVSWSGNIAPYSLEEISLGEFPIIDESLTIEFVQVSDENSAFNTIQPSILIAQPSSNNIYLNVQLDSYPTEFGFELYSVNDYEVLYNYEPGTQTTPGWENTFSFELPSPGCYTLEIIDLYGDGLTNLYGVDGYIEGYLELREINCELGTAELLSYNGEYTYSNLNIPIYVTSMIDLNDPNNSPGCLDSGACNYDPAANCVDGSCLYIGSACFDGDYTTVGDTMDENCNCIGTPGFNSCSDNFGGFEATVDINNNYTISLIPNTTIPNIPEAGFQQQYNTILSLNISSETLYQLFFGSLAQDNTCCEGFHLDNISYIQNDIEYDLSQIGVTWECLTSDCIIDQNNNLCVAFSGIPNQLGSFPLRFLFSNNFLNYDFTFNLEHYTLNVIDPCAGEHPICLVTVDPTNGNNTIVWEPQQVDYITDYIIYKESNVANQFEQIGTVPYGSDGLFIDNNSNSSVQASLYKIGALNTCSAEPVVSLHHKTVHLTSNLGINNEVNLIWSAYEGENVDSYLIYRGTSANDLTLLTTVSGSITSYTDLSPINGSYYMIEVEGISCDPSREVLTSTSNIITIGNVGIKETTTQGIRAYPNPAREYIILEIPQELVGEMMVICDVTGREIYRSKTANTTNNINVAAFSSGSYVLRVGNQNVRFER